MFDLARATLPFVMLTSLAACGGAGGGIVQDMPGDTDLAFAELATGLEATLGAAGFADVGDINDGTMIVPTPLNLLPISGGAEYSGQIMMFVGEGADLILSEDPDALDQNIAADLLLGRASFSVTFSPTGGTIQGVASDFADSNNLQYSGALNLADTSLLRGTTALQSASANIFAGTSAENAIALADDDSVTGFATGISGELTAVSGTTQFNGGALGVLSGPDADVVGMTLGTATTDSEPTDFFGLFVATE